MKSVHVLILSIFLSIVPHALIAAGLMHGSGNPASIGKGGTGVSGLGAGYFNINPAALAAEERFYFSTGFGSLDMDYIFSDSIFAFPTSYGVIGGNFKYFANDDIDEKFKSYGFSIGMGKNITSRLIFGMALKGMQSDYSGGNFYTGIGLGAAYKLKGQSRLRGFGFFDPVIGVSSDLGYFSDKSTDLNSVNGGYSFAFYKNDFSTLKFYNDLSVIDRFKSWPLKFGLESLFMDKFIIRGGAVFPQKYDYMSWSAGAGYIFTGAHYNASLDYSFTYSKEKGVSHFAGISLNYGTLDVDPPKTFIKPDLNYISPNYDGNQDYLIFSTEVEDKSLIKGWRLEILNEDDFVVREFRIRERDIEEKLTPGSFFTRLISRKESMVVPTGIFWDGSDGKGNILPDGNYKYYFYAWDSRENISPVKTGLVVIDTVSPEVSLKPRSYIFSPNDDGNLDFLIIDQHIKTDPGDLWFASIKNSQGNEVVSYKWEGIDVPAQFQWDGRDDRGNLQPDGLYYYSISSRDKAGNSATSEVKEITLTTQMEIADIRLSEEYFSYRNSKLKGLRFFPDLSEKDGLARWEIEISHAGGTVVKNISGAENLPAFVDWDCLDDEAKALPDGEFFVKFKAWFISGNNPESFGKKIIFDSTPPLVSISHEPELFSPDNDGENDLLVIKIISSDNSGIKGWDLKIFNESGVLFKSFSGSGAPPKEIVWDGIGDSEELVESASDYIMELVCFDFAGNLSDKAVDKLLVDILVVVTERGLKMRISNIEFAFGSAALGTRGKKILDRVAVILEKYSRYNVVVEGHTDDVGTVDYNQKLSEQRAVSVRDYLVKQGVDISRLQYEGFGESMPFYPNTNEENRRRNRRVEFLLLKKQD
ncbi:MAG: OmpA family protein [Spirochaetota bacterium]